MNRYQRLRHIVSSNSQVIIDMLTATVLILSVGFFYHDVPDPKLPNPTDLQNVLPVFIPEGIFTVSSFLTSMRLAYYLINFINLVVRRGNRHRQIFIFASVVLISLRCLKGFGVFDMPSVSSTLLSFTTGMSGVRAAQMRYAMAVALDILIGTVDFTLLIIGMTLLYVAVRRVTGWKGFEEPIAESGNMVDVESAKDNVENRAGMITAVNSGDTKC